MVRPEVHAIFDPHSCTVSYIAACPHTKACAIIDPVLDFDLASGRTGQDSAQKLIAIIEDNGLEPVMILETHVHADHLSAAPWLKQRYGCPIVIGDDISETQKAFAPVYALESEISGTGAEFDRLLADDEAFKVGELDCRALHTPGHTPACMTYLIGDAAFVGDTLFMPDFGTARCDFPGGSAQRFTARSSGCSPCRTRHGCSCAMITKRRAGTSMPGRPRWPSSARAIFMSAAG
jgi:glyoxylase-like metal-dependent hydrolase (beta-lactamase superfamily II)